MASFRRPFIRFDFCNSSHPKIVHFPVVWKTWKMNRRRRLLVFLYLGKLDILLDVLAGCGEKQLHESNVV